MVTYLSQIFVYFFVKKLFERPPKFASIKLVVYVTPSKITAHCKTASRPYILRQPLLLAARRLSHTSNHQCPARAH